MGEAGQKTPNRGMAFAVLIVVIAAAAGYALVSASSSHTIITNATPTTLAIADLLLLIPQNRPTCATPVLLCQSPALLTATVSVDGRTPLSCLDVYINSSSEGEDCWNLTSPAFTQTQCNGSGNQTSCTAIVSSNTNTETARNIGLSHQVNNGSDGGPLILVGKPYQITLVAKFEDGSNSTISAIAIATISNRFGVSIVSAKTTAPPL